MKSVQLLQLSESWCLMVHSAIVTFIREVYPLFGWLGALVIVLGCSLSAWAYRGKDGERYELQNHFISELGEPGISVLAIVFNASMIIGGIFFVLMMLGVGLTLGGVWGFLAMSTGIAAGVFCALVGVFPMNRIKPHTFVATAYFRSGLLTALLFTVAIFAQPAGSRVIPLHVNIFGILALLSYAVFLLVLGRAARKHKAETNVLDTAEVTARPKFWLFPFLEWLVFFSTLLWFLVLSISQIT